MSSSKKMTCKGQVFIRAYRLEIQSVMLVFDSPRPLFPQLPRVKEHYVWGGGGYWDYILQEFNTLRSDQIQKLQYC